MYRKKIPYQFPPSFFIVGQEYLGFLKKWKSPKSELAIFQIKKYLNFRAKN